MQKALVGKYMKALKYLLTDRTNSVNLLRFLLAERS